MKKQQPKYVAATLKWCNARRKEMGKRPLRQMPKGRKHDPESCPCGKATGLHVGGVWWSNAGERAPHDDKHKLPNLVQNFIISFDLGELPQYELYK